MLNSSLQFIVGATLAALVVTAHAASSVLFIGNSFTYGAGSAVRYYRADTVTDLNNEGIGGVPALFKSFAAQAGLDYDVYLETRGGSGLDFHLENKLEQLGAAVSAAQLLLPKPGSPKRCTDGH